MFKGLFPRSMFAFIDSYFTGEKKSYMEGYGVNNNILKLDTKSNQLSFYAYDEMLKNNQDSIYAAKISMFYKRDKKQTFSKPAISNDQVLVLNNIRKILKSHNTTYKIIINPLYDQIKLNQKDLDYLTDLFGVENVYDFSGINLITNDYHHYYKTSHYRPFVCDSILHIIYKDRKIASL